MRQLTLFIASFALVLSTPRHIILAQVSAKAAIRGTIRAQDGRPVAGANVFLLETLDGAITDSSGHFKFTTSEADSVTLVVKAPSFAELRQKLAGVGADTLLVFLRGASHALAAVTVQASRYSAGDDPHATLTSLDVVTTPGANADVNRAIQTLPGVQQVDEGNGLFVRGGDYTETKVFLDDAVILDPQDVQSPTGTFTGTVDPFLLDGIVFSSGGFGARFGNALSGVVSLHTQGQPLQSSVTASAGLAALSASVAQPIGQNLGIRAAADLYDITPLLRLNGSWQHYDPAPKGHDLSGSATWKSDRAGELSVFAIEQSNQLGVDVDNPSFNGSYSFDGVTDLAVADWHAAYGHYTPSLSLSTTHSAQTEAFGALDLVRASRLQQGIAQVAWAANLLTTFRAGVEFERLRTSLSGLIPYASSNQAIGAPVNVLSSSELGVRAAVFGEGDLRIGPSTRVVIGVRTDSSSLTRQRTVDPRISAAYHTAVGATVTAAWGVYHEVPDPLLFDPTVGDTTLRSMRATHSILGVQLGEGAAIGRIELYDKEYSNLAQQDRNYRTVANGRGFARGVDLFLKADGPSGIGGRLTYSHVLSRRTDPSTGGIADAPFDIPNSATVILEEKMGGWTFGSAYRYASGKPFTPVVGATRDSASQSWIPRYGDAMSGRLPHFERVDLSVSEFRPISPEWKLVLYASVNNVFGRNNLYTYTYTTDYQERIPVRSLFNRALYFGATIIH